MQNSAVTKHFLQKPGLYFALAMPLVIWLSNYLYGFVINEWLTYGAFSYPLCYLITDCINRNYGARAARQVVYLGFTVGVILSVISGWQIALASGTAFLISQLVDIKIFNILRQQSWWRAPLISSVLASVLDTVLFFSIAFYGTGASWWQLAMGDQLIKWVMVIGCLPIYRLIIVQLRQQIKSPA